MPISSPIWLVVSTPLKNMSSSIGMIISNICKNISVMFQSPPTRSWYLIIEAIHPIKSHETIIFLWFSYGFPMVFLWFSQRWGLCPSAMDWMTGWLDSDFRQVYGHSGDARSSLGRVMWWSYPLVMTNVVMENGPFIDDFPSYKPPVDSPWLC